MSISKPYWMPENAAFTATNGSEITLTVPDRFLYEPLALAATLTTSATAGQRQLELRFYDESLNIIQRVTPSLYQQASLTYNYDFGLGNASSEALIDSQNIIIALPLLILREDYTVTLLDTNTIDTSGDSLSGRLFYLKRAWRA